MYKIILLLFEMIIFLLSFHDDIKR